jgi:uncharacterized protein (DUF1778 family)
MVRHRKKRTARVPVRCTPEEKPIWERAAAEQDMDLSDYIVRLVRADIEARQKAAAAAAVAEVPAAAAPARAGEPPPPPYLTSKKAPAKKRRPAARR